MSMTDRVIRQFRRLQRGRHPARADRWYSLQIFERLVQIGNCFTVWHLYARGAAIRFDNPLVIPTSM